MQFTFDTAAVEKRESSFELLPAGWYDAQVIESSVDALKSGNGTAIRLVFEVLTEGFRGRKLWSRLNVRHTNPTAEKIAQQQLRELCDSIGLTRMTDTTQLHNKPVSIKVKVRLDASGQYEPQNDVVASKALGSAAPPPSTTRGFPAAPPRTSPPQPPAPAASGPSASQSEPAPAPAGPAAPPWAKRAA